MSCIDTQVIFLDIAKNIAATLVLVLGFCEEDGLTSVPLLVPHGFLSYKYCTNTGRFV